MSIDPSLVSRANGQCELCGGAESLVQHDVASASGRDDASIVVCGGCALELADGAELSPKHWHCLQTAVWSEVPAVQVVSFRLLGRLRQESWASDLLEQAYLADDVLAWANEAVGGANASAEGVDCRDSNGTPLADGDAVTLIKDLDVKGAGFVAKRGTMVKGIRLTDDPKLVEGRVNGVAIVLKTEFLKKA